MRSNNFGIKSVFVFVCGFLIINGCKNEAPVSSNLPKLENESVRLAEDQSDQFTRLSKTTTERADVVQFLAAGSVGGGVLVPGTFFPPIKRGFSILHRGEDWLSYNLHTTGLPAGAYTNWWVIINNPENCDGECDLADVFENPATNPSVFWATGGIVQENGVGNFSAKIGLGELPDGPDQIGWPGPGLLNPATAVVMIIVKYHGPASDDPDELFDQTYTLTGLCDEGANGIDLGPAGIHCFDPQIAVHRP